MVSYMLIGICSISAGIMISLFLGRRKNVRTWGIHDTSAEINVQGKVVVITGSSTGIGKQVALEFAKRGAILVLPCRNAHTGLETVAQLKQALKAKGLDNCISTSKLIPMIMDLSDLNSIRSFVQEFKSQFNQIHILINNAGVYIPYNKEKRTVDQFELNFGINYLSHFLLTNLLLEECKNGSPARIVNVASTLHEKAELKLDDLNLQNLSPEEESKIKPYNHSKLAQIYFSYELANRLAGTGVHTYALCPGWVKTSLNRNMDLKWYQYLGMLPFAILFMRDVEQGSQTILHCALSKEAGLETGKLYRNCAIWNSSKLPIPDQKAKALWEQSSKLVGI